MDNELLDQQGRVLTVEFEDFYLVTCYTPCAGLQLEKLDYRVNHWDVGFFNYVTLLNESNKGVIVSGDLNVAINDNDCFQFQGRNEYCGFTS